MGRLVVHSVSVVLFLLVASSSDVYAQKIAKAKATQFINRTNMVIKFAKEVVHQNKVYTGNLNKAVFHQKYARELYHEGKFKKAVFHSSRARALAFLAIRANNSKAKPEMEITAAEQDILKDIPIAAQLDAEVTIPAGTNDETAAAEKEVDVI